MSPGEQITVNYTLENTGDQDGTATGIDITQFPGDWTITSQSSDWQSNQQTWLTTSTLGPGETYEVTATLTVNQSASTGDYSLDAIGTVASGVNDTASATITVAQAPTASATANATSVETGDTVQFDASGSTDDGTITSYSWNFGDGATATGQTTTHSFSQGGTYDVTLTVTDDQGATDTDTVTVDVATTEVLEPEVSQITEDQGNFYVSFNTRVANATTGATLDAVDNQFTLYARPAGQADFARVDVPASAVTQVSGAAEYRIDASVHPLGDVSPASEVKVYVRGVQPASVPASNTSFDVTPGNTTASLASERILESTTDSTSRQTAERVYQGSPITFYADETSATDVPILLENMETGEILLDGSTGPNSQQIVFDSDNLESGTTYRLTFNEQGSPSRYAGAETEKYVNITSLRLSASLDQDGTLFEHDEAAELDVSGDAIRGNSDLAIEVRDSDGNLEAVYSDRLNNRAEFDFSASISSGNIEAGDYTVTVIDVETGVSVEAGSFSVDEFPEASSASFDGGVFEEERGDVIEIPITLRNSVEGAQAHVSVGSLGDTNYVTNVTVADQNGDGEVTLLFNTFMAGTENLSAVFQAEGPDTVDNWRGENGSFVSDLANESLTVGAMGNNLSRAKVATLDAASYELQVAAAQEGDDFQNFSFSDSEADDVGAIDLGTRSTENVVNWRLSSASANELLAEGLPYVFDEAGNNLTQTDRVTSGEYLVAQIVASGVEGPIKNQTNLNGHNDTFAFLVEADTNGDAGGVGHNYAMPRTTFSTGFQLSNPEPNENLRTFALESTNDFVFLPDYQNDTYYIAVNIDEVDQSKLEDNDLWNTTFGFASYDAIGPVLGGTGGGSVQSDFAYETADASLQPSVDTTSQLIQIRNLEGQTITANTNVAPGTVLNIQIQSESDNSPFLIRPRGVVEAGNGSNQLPNTLTITEDFSARNAGINFTAQVRRGTQSLGDEFDGRLLGRPTASVTINDQSVSSEVETQAVTVASVTMSDGGFVVIHGEDGAVLGASSYRSAGTHQNVRVALDENLDEGETLVAMPHLDTDGDNVYEFAGGSLDAPYTTSDGAPVTDSASVSVVVDTPVPTDTPTDTPTPTATPTPTDTPTPTATPTDTPEPMTPTETDEPDTPTPTTTTTGPGFGVVVAVIALLAAALLAARRRD